MKIKDICKDLDTNSDPQGCPRDKERTILESRIPLFLKQMLRNKANLLEVRQKLVNRHRRENIYTYLTRIMFIEYLFLFGFFIHNLPIQCLREDQNCYSRNEKKKKC